MDQSQNNWQQDAPDEQAQAPPSPDFVSNSPYYRPGFSRQYDDDNSQAMAAAMGAILLPVMELAILRFAQNATALVNSTLEALPQVADEIVSRSVGRVKDETQSLAQMLLADLSGNASALVDSTLDKLPQAADDTVSPLIDKVKDETQNLIWGLLSDLLHPVLYILIVAQVCSTLITIFLLECGGKLVAIYRRRQQRLQENALAKLSDPDPNAPRSLITFVAPAVVHTQSSANHAAGGQSTNTYSDTTCQRHSNMCCATAHTDSHHPPSSLLPEAVTCEVTKHEDCLLHLALPVCQQACCGNVGRGGGGENEGGAGVWDGGGGGEAEVGTGRKLGDSKEEDRDGGIMRLCTLLEANLGAHTSPSRLHGNARRNPHIREPKRAGETAEPQGWLAGKDHTDHTLSSEAPPQDHHKPTMSLIDTLSNVATPTGHAFGVAPQLPVALSAPACLSRGTSQDGCEGGRVGEIEKRSEGSRGLEATSAVCAPPPHTYHATAEDGGKCAGEGATVAHSKCAGGVVTVGAHTHGVSGGVGSLTRSRALSRLAPLLPTEPASKPLAPHHKCIGPSPMASPSSSCGTSSGTPTGARFSLRAAFPAFSVAASNGFVAGGTLAAVVASSFASVEMHGAAAGVGGGDKGGDGEGMERVPGYEHTDAHTPLSTDYCNTQGAMAWSDSAGESGGKGDERGSWGGIGGGGARIVGALRANLSSASKMASSMHRRTKSSPVMLRHLVVPWEGVRSGSGDGLLVRGESDSFSLLQHAQEDSFAMPPEGVLQAVPPERTVLPNCQDQDSGEWPHDWFERAQHKDAALKHAALPSTPPPTTHSNASEPTTAKMENGEIAVRVATRAATSVPTCASESLPFDPTTEVVASVGNLQPLATHLQTGSCGHSSYGEREREGGSGGVDTRNSGSPTNHCGLVHHKRSYTYSDGCNPFAPNLF